MTSRDALDKTKELRHLRTTGAERLNLMRFAREVEAFHQESPRLNEYHYGARLRQKRAKTRNP